MVIPESLFDYYLLVDPLSSQIERDMLIWIENYCVQKKKNISEKIILTIHTIEGNEPRDELLKNLGYSKSKIIGYLRFRSVDQRIQQMQKIEGIRIRSINQGPDYEQLAQAIRLVFGHGDWFTTEILKSIAR